MMTTRSRAAPRRLDAGLGDLHDVLRRAIRVDRHVELRAERLELVDGGGSIDVARDESRLSAFGFELTRELRGGCRLSRSLKPDHHHDRRRDGAELESLARLAEHGGELVVDDLDELLAGRDGAELRDADRFLFDALEELARELEVDVGLEEHAADLAQPLFDVGFGEDAPASQPGKRGLQFFGKLVEHRL